MDANKRVSKSTLNDFCTIVEALKSGELDIDGIFSTLGIICSQERILAKKLPDYFNTVKLVNFKGGYDWMHAMVMKNIKKYYNVELYCDLACNNLDFSGTIPEDIYFTRLFRKLFDCRLAPTVTVSTPSNKTSTWVSNKVGYDYPKPDGKLIDKLVSQCIVRDNLKQFNRTEKTLTLPRIDKYKDLVKGYSPKSKAVKTNLLRGTDGKI